jgi:hypothetical protein
VQIAGNAILVFFHPRFLHHLGQAVFGVVSLFSIIVVAAVFPLDFAYVAAVLNTLVRVALIVGAVATGISVVVSLFRAIGSLVRGPRK